jgi:hypothetical protein
VKPEPKVELPVEVPKRFYSKNIDGNLHDVRIWCNKNLQPEDKIVFIERVSGYLSVIMWERNHIV